MKPALVDVRFPCLFIWQEGALIGTRNEEKPIMMGKKSNKY